MEHWLSVSFSVETGPGLRTTCVMKCTQLTAVRMSKKNESKGFKHKMLSEYFAVSPGLMTQLSCEKHLENSAALHKFTVFIVEGVITPI